MEYDFATRFDKPLEIIGDGWTWGKSIRMVKILRADPSSALAAAIEGWDHPISREALILMDIFDLDHAINSKKTPKPHSGRPWKQDDERRERRGNAAGRTREQVVAILRRFGHGEKVESDA